MQNAAQQHLIHKRGSTQHCKAAIITTSQTQPDTSNALNSVTSLARGLFSSHRCLPPAVLADLLPGGGQVLGWMFPSQIRGTHFCSFPQAPLLCRVYGKVVQGQGSQPSSALPSPWPRTFRALVRSQTQQRSQRGSTSETGSRLQ